VKGGISGGGLSDSVSTTAEEQADNRGDFGNQRGITGRERMTDSDDEKYGFGRCFDPVSTTRDLSELGLQRHCGLSVTSGGLPEHLLVRLWHRYYTGLHPCRQALR
jgi:hypothetical protein